MSSVARLLSQRSSGEIRLKVDQSGVRDFREAGSAKLRIPRGSHEAILINCSGGLAGGDQVDIDLCAGRHAKLMATSQAAERVYRTLGPSAEIRVKLTAEDDAMLYWMPQETILFDGSSLRRQIDVDLGRDARFLAVECMVVGRQEMGETVRQAQLHDHWTIRQDGKIVHAERFGFGPIIPRDAATFGRNCAAATVVLIAPHCERLIDLVRAQLGPIGGASTWNGKLIARLMAATGFELRKQLIRVLSVCLEDEAMPKVWTL